MIITADYVWKKNYALTNILKVNNWTKEANWYQSVDMLIFQLYHLPFDHFCNLFTIIYTVLNYTYFFLRHVHKLLVTWLYLTLYGRMIIHFSHISVWSLFTLHENSSNRVVSIFIFFIILYLLCTNSTEHFLWNLYIYIYIYIYSERERRRRGDMCPCNSCFYYKDT